jgi:hypothetical protein
MKEKIVGLLSAFIIGVVLIWFGMGSEIIIVTLLGGTLTVVAPLILLILILMDR